MKRKLKKASHVGFILSFVIFVTSVFFLYTLLVPSLKTDVAKETVVNSIRTELIEKISSDLISLTVTIDGSGGSDNCLQFVNLISDNGISGRIIIQNEIGQVFIPYVSSSSVYVDRTINTSSKLFKISVSEEFPLASSTPPSCTVSGYSIGLIRTEKNIFQSRIEGVLDEYRNDYNTLKGELSVPKINEFGFGFVYENGTFIGTKDPNLSISVYSQRIPVRYIDIEANKKSGDLEVRAW